jgi:hypothetical protein
MTRLLASALAIVCGVLIVSAGGSATAAQSASESALKAAFLYNFARFTEWPAEELEAAAPLDICLTDVSVAEALEPMIAGKSVGDHLLVVTRLRPDGTPRDGGARGGLRACEMLYLGRLDLKASHAVLMTLAGQSVFSVSDVNGFAQAGGVARFFVDGANLRFEINMLAARRSRLEISAKLLQIAIIVKDK